MIMKLIFLYINIFSLFNIYIIDLGKQNIRWEIVHFILGNRLKKY